MRRLQVEYIDLYQTHWPDPTTPIAETMGELMKLKEEGKIRAIGVSNVSVAQMEEYRAVGQLDSDQPLYNMLDRGIEADILPYCRKEHIAILSYSSLAMGLLSGKMNPTRQFAATDQRAHNARFQPEFITRVNHLLEQFAPFRTKYGLDQTQLSIAWTISHPGITTALVGVRTPQQAADIAPGGSVLISAEDLAAMDGILATLGEIPGYWGYWGEIQHYLEGCEAPQLTNV